MNKKIKLAICVKIWESLNSFFDNLDRMYYLIDHDTPCSLINDTLTITRGINSKYTKKYDVEYEYRCFILL